MSTILTASDESWKRFITEAQAASALDHPNICTIFEINKTNDGQMFIAMRFYEGETLDQKISNGPLNIQEVINITIHLADGLSKAHEKGIIYRDLKPANIMITNDGMVIGLARLSACPTLTKTGTMLGTAVYLSPEQAKGDLIPGCIQWTVREYPPRFLFIWPLTEKENLLIGSASHQ